MEKITEVNIFLAWSHPHCGSFKAQITNGRIASLALCEEGAGEGNAEGKCLVSVNEMYLRALYDTLGELFAEVDKANADIGYKYAKNETATPDV